MQKLKKYFLFLNNSSLVNIEEKIVDFLKSLPKLPKSAVDFLISLAPFLALIGGVLSLLSIVSFFIGTSALFYSAFPLSNAFPYLYIALAASVISGLMLIAAFEDLKNKKIFGWRLVFWAMNIGILSALIGGNIFGAVVSAFLSWYVLSQLRGEYS